MQHAKDAGGSAMRQKELSLARGSDRRPCLGSRGATVVVRLKFCRATALAGPLRRADLANILLSTSATLVLKEDAVQVSGGVQQVKLEVVVPMGKAPKSGSPPVVSVTFDWPNPQGTF